MPFTENGGAVEGHHDFRCYVEVATEVAQRGGRMIKESFEKRRDTGLHVEVKCGVDMVTEVDKAVEEVILSQLKQAFPTHRFVGEESTFTEGGTLFTNEPTWVIDPLDGTTNFVHGYPFVAVSIGLMINEVSVVGVIYNPFLEELYTAWKDGGAYLNGKRIRVATAKGVGDALVVNNIGSCRSSWFLDKTVSRLRTLLRHQLQGLRMSGSAAQNLAHVATGKLDAYLEDGYGGPWDVAAGKVLVEEAGGVVKAVDGSEFKLHPGKGKIIAGNASVVDDIVNKLRWADRGLVLRKVHSLVSSAATLYVVWHLASGLVGRRRAILK